MDHLPAKIQSSRNVYLLGEISLFLTILSISIILIGSFIGANTAVSKQLRTTFGRASENQASCSFRTTFGVYEEGQDGSLRALTKQDADLSAWGVSNDKQLEKNTISPSQTFGDIAEVTFATERLPLKPQTGADYANEDRASVKLFADGIDEGYELMRTFCTSNNSGPGCPPDIAKQDVGTTIRDFEITCGVDINYGWVVKSKEGSATSSPTPQSSQVTPSIELSPTPPASQTPPDTTTQSKDTYSLFTWSTEHGGEDMCFINADTKLGEHRSQGKHCNVISCKDRVTNEPTALVVDFTNKTNPAEDPLNLSAQINHCPGKVLGELAGNGKNECNNFISRKDNFPVGHGKKVRCVWKNPSDKATIALNFTCQEVRESDPKSPEGVCAEIEDDEPEAQKEEASSPGAPTRSVSLAPTKAKKPAPTKSVSPRVSPTKRLSPTVPSPSPLKSLKQTTKS
ncbi:MAG: hypothetical protein UZ21_OP11001000366 [Microgenomates bacterium OLB22]|nr:MAG: hypothetical protein UZ21_OP11001000366 [Microgenomates bacterium OLB22]